MLTIILVDTGPLTITKKIYQSGTQADVGVVTVDVVDANGTVVATGASTTKNGAAETTTYDYAIPKQTALTTLYLTWNITTTGEQLLDEVEVKGSLLFTEAAARAYTIGGGIAPLTAAKYDDEAIAAGRFRINELFEARTGQAWTRRHCRRELSGNGQYAISLRGLARAANGSPLDRPGSNRDMVNVLSCTVDGVAVATTDLVFGRGGILHRLDGVFTAATVGSPYNVVVEYEYGPRSVPAEANDNALRMLVPNLVPSELGAANVASLSNPGGTTFKLNIYPKRVKEWLDTFASQAQVF